MAISESSKVCLDCRVAKPISDFYVDGKGWRNTRCKGCLLARRKRYKRAPVPLTAEYLREHFAYDPHSGILSRIKYADGRALSGESIGVPDYKGYLRAVVLDRLHFVHRLIWLYVHGEWPVDQIDHINGIKPDNRLENLREATNAENRRNCPTRRDSESGAKGVTQDKRTGRWRAYICRENKRQWLGYFATIEEARAARREAATAAYGQFYRE